MWAGSWLLLARKEIHYVNGCHDGLRPFGPNDFGSIGHPFAHCCVTSLCVQRRRITLFILRRMPNSAAPLVSVERGGIEEAIHLGHLAVVDAQGRLHASLGDPGHVTYFRSCAKPFQAIGSLGTGIAQRYGLGSEHVAIMAASHNGEPRHVELVRDLLRRVGIEESALQFGAHWPYFEPAATAARHQMDQPLAVFNNCSGKHAGMLAAARALDTPLDTYLDPAHPVQQRIRGVVEAFTACQTAKIHYGIDGCSA